MLENKTEDSSSIQILTSLKLRTPFVPTVKEDYMEQLRNLVAQLKSENKRLLTKHSSFLTIEKARDVKIEIEG